MQTTPEQRLIELNIELPASSNPAGSYANAVRTGNLLYCSGKAPLATDSGQPKGKLGEQFTTKQGAQHARTAALDILSVVRSYLGSLDKVRQVVELQGFVNATPDFEEHPKVLDGASDLMAEIFGEAGVHARSVFGATSLRSGVPVVLRAVFEVDES